MANIKVAIRVRPISEREIHFTGSEIVVHTEEKAISLTNLKVSSSKAGDSRERTRKYGFDYCFDSSDPRNEEYASQSKIYETLGESILEVLFNGFNSCLVAYGQSASGKTYTMMGSKEDPGLTPRICEGLFLRLANKEKSDTNFEVSVSYLEVYNERVRDLLRPSASSLGLRVREHPRLGPYVQGLTHHPVSTLGSLTSRVEEGTRARKTASTLQNPTSSRSHALLTVSLRPSSSNIGQSATDASRNVPRTSERFQGGSKLHLVDLAGSESAAACGGINRLKEGANINKSLVALGNVISALAERGSSGSGPGRRFIPYRDSALTWLLKDALGGNATTIMLATISPASGSYNETSHTLRFAQRAQSVVNRPVINEDPVSRTIRELRAEVSRLKSLLVEKSVDPDCKFICTCQHEREQESKIQDHEAQVFDRNEPNEGKLRDEEEASIGEIHLRISERRHSTSESLLPRNQLSGLVRRFGSFEIAQESRKLSLDSIEPDNYNRAKVSELIIDDHIDEPVFVDIPTLVAVLIKPDDNVHVGGHQIEEISSDGVPEDVTDAEFSENVADHSLPLSNEFHHSKSAETRAIQCSAVDDDPTESQENQQPSVEARIDQRVKGKLEKGDSIDGELSAKKSSDLQSSKKYGSIENLPRKREIAWSFQRSQTNLDKRNGSLDRIKKLNNIKEIEDRGTVRSAASWRNLGSWEGRDYQRKGSNDSDKSLKESALLARSKNQARKQSIDGLKRKTSKDSSSSSSKDELSANGGGQTRERTSRKGSLEQEQPPTRTHTPIQRARRAEIVAAVTERLYSAKKLSEEATALTGTTASTPTSEVRSPESTDVKLASSTRMRLQEISRKMLAKRRRVCVDTQTDNHQTVRVRDASSITEEPKIISKDASVLTDQHEDYEIPLSVDYPVRRVKEIATCTDSDLRQPIVRCKDAANLTDDYYDDCATVHSPRNDSGIMSDDTQNYAESNLSTAEISDLSPVGGGRSVELVENSTNTGIPTVSLDSGSQTRREDLERAARCSHCDGRFCGVRHHCRGECGLNLSDTNDVRRHAERNVISISLPEMVNITIETSNGMESKIKVFDGNESVDERAMINLKDGMAQTERRDVLEASTSTDDSTGRVCLRNFSTSTKPIIGQSDGKTFRIENIFHEPHVLTRNTPKVEIIDDSSEDVAATNSLVVTNSVGTSFVPETRENATGTEALKPYSSEIFFGNAARRSLPNMTNTWPSRWTSCLSDNQRKKGYRDYSTRVEDKRSLSDISTNELHTRRGVDDALYQKTDRQPLLESNRQSLDDDIGLGKDETSVTNQKFSKTSREEPKDCSVAGSKSPSIIAMFERQANGEQETNFSDDSLDLMEDRTGGAYEKNEAIMESSLSNLKDEVSNEKVCPPDLVAHTKKDSIESSIALDHFDEFDEEQHIELPKTKVDGIAATSFPTPMSSFKTLILGDPSCTLHHANDSYLTDFRDQSSVDTLIEHEDYLCTTIDVVEDVEQCLVNGGRSVAPRSIIKKSTRNINGSRLTGACQSECGTKNLRNESSRTKKVRFDMPVASLMTNNDDEPCENPTCDKDFVVSGERNILEKYLDEAVAFMRNMNSMNEYMSATNASGKCTTNGRNRRREKGKRKNYIEYEGRRISLEDDTSEPVKSNDADDYLDFNVESYDKCLKSMNRLEECLARVRRHDEILRHKYGAGKDGSTGAKLDLAKFSVDPSDADRDPNDGGNLNDPGLRRNVNDNNVFTKRDVIDDGNNNPLPCAKEGDFSPEHSLTFSDKLKKLRPRRFSRFSELRKRNPATYSQLRNRHVSQAVDSRARKKDDIPSSATTVESFEADGSEDTIVPDGLQAPNCFLVLPKTTRTDVGPSDRFKGCTSRQRFSLSKYDSSNESSSSNEALASFIESIDNVARSKNKIRYPGSPRAKFLQLLSERRRIVENTRSNGAS